MGSQMTLDLQEPKVALPDYARVLRSLKKALGPNRKPLLIAIDGDPGVGKSSLASWLSWQLEMPAMHLGQYLIRDSKPLKWRVEEVSRLLSKRIDDEERPVIVEGILVLDALHEIRRPQDFLVFIEGETDCLLRTLLDEYRQRRKPQNKAHETLKGTATFWLSR